MGEQQTGEKTWEREVKQGEELTESKREKILTKIQNLIAKAEGTDNDYEKDIFWAKANELIAAYGLELAEILKRDKDDEALGIVHEVYAICKYASEVKDWKIMIGSIIGSYLMCQVYTLGSTRLLIAGRKLDILLWKQLYESVINQITLRYQKDVELAKSFGRIGRGSLGKVHVRTWTQSYNLAAAHAVVSRVRQLIRIREHEAQRQAQSGMSALMIVTHEQIDRHLMENFGISKETVTTYTPNSVETLQYDATLLGDRTGRQVAIQSGIEDGNKTKLGDRNG